ncbi:MAG TPA: SAM-dependent methyltransferase [Casimicrobiaceae bacterium]
MRAEMQHALPAPGADALAHSDRVVAHIRAEIERDGGFIPFSRYMELALYAPGLGYYVAGARRFGAAGDFVTGPELTPLYGAAIARQLAPILAASGERQIVELGAGSGALAASLLRAFAARDASPVQYRILEVSPALRAQQRATIETAAPGGAARVEWLERLPASIDGVVLMNEVLDAVAPRLVARRGDAWRERGVTWWQGAFAWDERPLDDAHVRALAEARFPSSGDFSSEVNPAAEALVATIAQRIGRGALLVVDYGFPRHEYYHPQRSDGTLVGHYRHRVHADPFLWPGLSDLTTHVDFTAVAEAGARGGLRVAGFATQASFLLGCGILELLHDAGAPESAGYLRAAAAVQKLLSPAEMGELFKVLLLARGAVRWRSLAVADMTHRL